jgi:hypothetical protein
MFHRVTAALIALILSASGARASHVVWSGLVIAQNVEHPQPAPSELAPLEDALKDLFGYNQFEIIGQSRKRLKSGQEDWLAWSKYFSLHVDAQGVDQVGYDLNLKLYQQKELLLETNTKLSARSPLVIKGPQIGGGQLLLVLAVEPEPEKKSASKHAGPGSDPFVKAWRHLTHLVRTITP